MFTGIILKTGQIQTINKNKIIIEANAVMKKLIEGGSIAVDGVCLTVVEKTSRLFTADVMPETFKKTILGFKKSGTLVNLELPMLATDCFEGHVVSGHVEGIGKITRLEKKDNSYLLTLQIPKMLTRYVVEKGSIALNGVSLTVIGIRGAQVKVGIIPHTFRHTNFQTLKVGDKVNIETDIMAKYLLQGLI